MKDMRSVAAGKQLAAGSVAVSAGTEFKEWGIVVTVPLRPTTNRKEKEKFGSHIYKPKGIVHHAESTYKGK